MPRDRSKVARASAELRRRFPAGLGVQVCSVTAGTPRKAILARPMAHDLIQRSARLRRTRSCPEYLVFIARGLRVPAQELTSQLLPCPKPFLEICRSSIVLQAKRDETTGRIIPRRHDSEYPDSRAKRNALGDPFAENGITGPRACRSGGLRIDAQQQRIENYWQR